MDLHAYVPCLSPACRNLDDGRERERQKENVDGGEKGYERKGERGERDYGKEGEGMGRKRGRRILREREGEGY